MSVLFAAEKTRIGAEAALDRFVERGRFGLEGDVADAEAITEECGEVGEDVLGAIYVGQFDVCAERREGWSDRPDVDIVERDDAFNFARGCGNGGRFEASRGAFEEDVAGLAKKAPCSRYHKRRNGEARKGVDSSPPAEGDDRRRNDDSDRAGGIDAGFERGGSHVQVVRPMTMEEPHDEQVHGKASQADGDHRAGLDRRRVAEMADGLEDDVTADQPEEHDMDRDDEDFEACQAVRVAARSGSSRERGRAEREYQAGGVG